MQSRRCVSTDEDSLEKITMQGRICESGRKISIPDQIHQNGSMERSRGHDNLLLLLNGPVLDTLLLVD